MNNNFDIFLMSFPRSGTNWLRYIVETLSQRPVVTDTNEISLSENIINNNPIAFQSHFCKYNKYVFKKTILIIRNYKECIYRHLLNVENINLNNYKIFINDYIINDEPSYINIISEFDKFNGEKLIIYYEDLIKYTKEEILKISNFINSDIKNYNIFIKNLDYHINFSLNLYKKTDDHGETIRKSETQGKFDLFYSNYINIELKKDIDLFLKENYKYLFDKYLLRYEEK